MQALAVSAQLLRPGPGRVGGALGASGDQREPFVDAVRGDVGGEIDVLPGHAKADVAVRGPAVSLLLVLTRRLPSADPGIEILGDQALFTHWLEHTPF